MNIPNQEECLDLLSSNNTPQNVIKHSKAVCKFAEQLADKLIKKGINVNKELVIAASLLHDIERVKDNHVTEGAKLLNKLGFPEVAIVAQRHGLHNFDQNQLETIEEKIVFYADKKINHSDVVSLEERFEYLKKRYGGDFKKELEFTKQIERELLQLAE